MSRRAPSSAVRLRPGRLTTLRGGHPSQQLLALLDVMVPGSTPALTTRSRLLGRRPSETYLPVPSWRAPRLLVPLSSRKAAAAALGLRSGPRHRPAHRWIYRVAAKAMELDVAQHLLAARVLVYDLDDDPAAAAGSFAEHVAQLLGSDTVVCPRVSTLTDTNRTLGMHVIDRDGRLVGFVKAGWNALTRQLVDNEAHAMQRLAAHQSPRLRAPQLLHRGTWNNLDFIIAEPLDFTVGEQPSSGGPTRLDVIEEIIGTGDDSIQQLQDSAYWSRTQQRLRTVTGSSAVDSLTKSAVTDVFTQLDDDFGAMHLRFGAWHGDWLPWNMLQRGQRLIAWDWEYWSDCAPAGFDVLHFFAGTALFRDRHQLDRALAQTEARSGPLLQRLGLTAASAEAVHHLYVFELVLRRLEIVVQGGAVDRALFPGMIRRAQNRTPRAIDGPPSSGDEPVAEAL